MAKFEDLTGQKFGRLTVIELHHKKQIYNKNGAKRGFRYFWLCQCDCGNTNIVRVDSLKNGSIKSCGCLKKNTEDLTGKRFGRWTVIKRSNNNKNNHIMWLCRCDCGTERNVYHNSLINKNSLSCGCYKNEINKDIHKKHNMCYSRIYNILSGMKARCYNPNEPAYIYYGARGIKVCDEWLDKKNGFINFYDWAINNGYQENLTIDRIDFNSDYYPSNCRWITKKEQQRNKRNNHLINYKNNTKCISEWCEELDLDYKVINWRLNNGWTPEQAFETPIYKGANQWTYQK